MGKGEEKFTFRYLATKVLYDEQFSILLHNDPKEALQSIGIEATEEILEALKTVDKESIQRVAEAFSDYGEIATM